MLKILYKEQEYVFTGNALEDGGAIALQDDFENGQCSYAHLYPDGSIMRFQEQIGTVNEITVIGNVDPDIGIHSLIGCLTDPSWPINNN